MYYVTNGGFWIYHWALINMCLFVCLQRWTLSESLSTRVANKRLFSCMYAEVWTQIVWLWKCFRTKLADVRFLASVCTFMPRQNSRSWKFHFTHFTFVRFLPRMYSFMFCQRTGRCKSMITNLTHKRPSPCNKPKWIY